MKIITTGDWHLGNLFHGSDRLPEHRHFLNWLLSQVEAQQPDALLVAGDIFDNGNPSAAAQSAYYEFLAKAVKACPQMQVVITAGNHDSANRLEAPRPMLKENNVEIRGTVKRVWESTPEGGEWKVDFDDLIIPLKEDAIVLAVPYLRYDVLQAESYSEGVMGFLKALTARARELHPGKRLIMMAHMYAKGADIAQKDASEKIVIGGQEEVDIKGWEDHPDYLTCGHIHKRQHIWGTDWARYTGSVLPMSFAEKDYVHGVDMVTFGESGKPCVEHLAYQPQHRLRQIPEDDAELTPAKLRKLVLDTLMPRGVDGKLSERCEYVVLKVKIEKLSNDEIKEMEELVGSMDAVLCKIQKIIPAVELTTLAGGKKLESMEDILNRDPMDTLRETFLVDHGVEMNERQEALLQAIVNKVKPVVND